MSPNVGLLWWWNENLYVKDPVHSRNSVIVSVTTGQNIYSHYTRTGKESVDYFSTANSLHCSSSSPPRWIAEENQVLVQSDNFVPFNN